MKIKNTNIDDWNRMKSESQTKELKKTEDYRNDITLHLIRIGGDVERIKEDISDIKSHLSSINGRVRQNEKDISWVKGIGGTFAFLIGAILTWLGLEK